MACSAQSALDLISKNRRHLVGVLKNLGVSVIVENLNDHGVFCDEEVSKIKAERDDYEKSRAILDKVIRKGEAACYRLLKVIDTMLRRTSGRRSSLPEKTTEALTGTKEPDLLFMISCFPFIDDTEMDPNYSQGPKSCHRYKAKLKSKAQKRSKEFWMRNKNQFEGVNMPDLSYRSLVLDTKGRDSPSKIQKAKKLKSKMIRPKKLRTYIPKDRPEISPSDLLKTGKNILLVGKPGIGKTALSHEILKLWAETDSSELDYMFYFDMRETSLVRDGMSLEELLFSAYREPDEDKEEVLQEIKKYSDNVTVVFDGITDLSSSLVQRIVDKDLLPNAKVIITCRPDDESLFSGDFHRVEVKGFSEQTIKKYCSAMPGMEQKVSSNLELLTLCHVPMYALMVAVCFLSETPEDSPQPCSLTEIYINIVRFRLRTSSNKKPKNLNALIKEKRADLLTLAEAAFHATEEKTVSLTDLHCEDSCVLSFLKPLVIKVAPTETTTTYAFLHYTMQEFFAAMWLLMNPDKIREVFQQCLTEKRKHMKHMLPFMCRLLTKKSPSLMEHLIPAQELKNTSNWFLKEMISTFSPVQCYDDEAHTEDTGLDVDILFLCQCLFESQCPDACTSFLETLEYQLDLSSESFDSYLCCAVAYVVAQSKKKKIQLDLEGVSVSEEGMRHLYGCLNNVQWCDPLPKQLLEIVLHSEGKLNELSLLGLDGNQLHLPVQGKKQLFEIAGYVIQNNPMKINVCLHWDDRASTACPNLCGSLLEALLDVSSLSFRMTHQDPELEDQEPGHGTLERKKKQLLLDLCLQAALCKEESFHHVVYKLVSLFSADKHLHNFFVDLYQHVKTGGPLGVIPKLGRLFESADGVWSINLSEINTSILLEVLRLRPEKTPVKLTGCPDEESEVRSFLQCLPHISQLGSERVEFCGRLFCAAAEREQQTGENTLQLLSSLCTYKTFPLFDEEEWEDYKEEQCYFLLDLYSHMKDYETKTGWRVLPSLQSVFQLAPDVWCINLSKRKTSILLEVLRLRPEKTRVELRGCPYEESEVSSFLQCLPHISQLSFSFSVWSKGVEFCGRLFCAAAAAEREQQTGENTLQLLSSLCTYKTFPFFDVEGWYHDKKYQCYFLLDLCSHMKDCETKTGWRVLPSLQSVFQSAPDVWCIDLSERKTSILLEVLRLRPEKTRVKLKGCPDEESEVRSFLQCLPHISQLSCSQPEFFQIVCRSVSVRSRDEAEQLVTLLRLLGFTLQLTGKLHNKTCKSVGRVLGLCGPHVDLILTPRMMSARGASLLFRHTKRLHSLRLSNSIALLLSGWVRRQRVPRLTVAKQLSLASQSDQPSEKVLLRVVSSLASLLRYWTVRHLDLTEAWIPAQCLISLLSHDGPLTIKLHEKTSPQLLDLLYQTQDEDLTLGFLRKVNGDLTPFCLNWELLQHLLQQSSQIITVNLRKNSFIQESITRLLPFLDRIVFVRTCPSFVLTSLREIYTTRASSVVPSFLRSFDHVINLTCREIDSEDCAALLFILKHSDGVKLNLLWTSIPTGDIQSILCTLDKVSQLSVDRNLLLKFLYCCADSDDQQRAAVSLLRTLQHRLDLSCSSCVELSEEGQSETLRLTVADCSAVSILLRCSSQDTELHLQDCEVEDSGLDLMFPVLDKVRLRANKVVLLQLVSLVPSIIEGDSMRRAGSLCKALGGELDLSHTVLDQKACRALAWMLDFSEGLTELDLSHCQLTDQLLLTIKEHLHKVHVLDLSHNKITDASTSTLLELISNNPSIETVRLFRNDIVNQAPFKKTKKFEIW